MADAPNIVPAEKTTHISSGNQVIDLNDLSRTPAPAPAAPAAPAMRQEKASEGLMSRLRERTAPQTPPTAAPAAEAKSEPEKPVETTPETKTAPETPKAAEAPAAPDGEKKEKANPWKLVEELKSTRSKLEAEVAELRRGVKDEATRKAEEEDIARTKSRIKELEDEIRYTNYQKSTEFKEKYEKPYTDYFKHAMRDMDGLTVNDDSGERPIQPNDLLQLVTLNTREAKEKAEEMFGDYASEAMSHRKELRRLFEERSEALERAKTEGAEREKRRISEIETEHSRIKAATIQMWEEANKAFATDEAEAPYLNAPDSEPERKEILNKGYELVDRALANKSPMDPSLTAEERAQILRNHATIRHRAAAYDSLKHLLSKERETIRALEERLSKYEKSTPASIPEGSSQSQQQVSQGSAWDRMRSRLASKAV